jgi:hypothetical protein
MVRWETWHYQNMILARFNSMFGKRCSLAKPVRRLQRRPACVHQKKSSLANAMTQCDAFGIAPAQAAAQVQTVIAVVDTWRTHFASHGVSTSDRENLAQTLDGDELLKQRKNFDANQYQGAVPKRKPLSPFRRA